MTLEEAIRRMESIRDRADEILALFEKGGVQANRLAGAQEKFRGWTEELKSEYERMDKGKATLSETEKFFYQPAIEDAWLHEGLKSLRWDSTPDGHWQTAIGSARNYMDYWIEQARG